MCFGGSIAPPCFPCRDKMIGEIGRQVTPAGTKSHTGYFRETYLGRQDTKTADRILQGQMGRQGCYRDHHADRILQGQSGRQDTTRTVRQTGYCRDRHADIGYHRGRKVAKILPKQADIGYTSGTDRWAGYQKGMQPSVSRQAHLLLTYKMH